jgi:hypothetical protein
MLVNHKNRNKNKNDKLSDYDVRYLNLWIAGWRGNPLDKDYYIKKADSTYIPIPSKYRFSVTRVAGGICLDCEKERCTICNCCMIDIFGKDLENHHCMRCICDEYEGPEEPLNNTGKPLEELVRKKQGYHRSKKKEGKRE